MTDNIYWKMNEDDEHYQDEPSSRHLLVALEDLLKRSVQQPTFTPKNRHQSKSVDDLLLYQHEKHPSRTTETDDQTISNVTRTEFDLSGIGYNDEGQDDREFDSEIQRSRSAPASPTRIYEQELAAFVDCDQSAQQFIADNFVFNVDLSDSNETSHPTNSKLAIFFEDDFSPEDINYEPAVSLLHSSLINNCLTITEENEEELEQLRRDDHDNNNNNQLDRLENEEMIHQSEERLSTIYESPSPQPETDENIYDKLIVYDVANSEPASKSFAPSTIDRARLPQGFADASFEPCPNFTNTLTASRLCGTTTIAGIAEKKATASPPILLPIDETDKKLASAQHVTKMKVFQSSLSSLSDFISAPASTLPNTSISRSTNPISDTHQRKPSFTRGILTNGLLLSHCANNSVHRRVQEPKDDEQHRSDSSSSSEMFSSDEKLLSRSAYLLQREPNLSPQRKSSSLKSIPIASPQSSSNILYPIDFQFNHATDLFWHQQQSPKVPTSDSGIVIDTRPTSKSSTEEENNHLTDQLQQHESNYRQTLTDLRLIKHHIVDIESRLTEAMQELQIEQALIEGEHELVFKQILQASESDQQKIRQLYRNLQGLVDRIMTEKNSLRSEIEYTEQTIRKMEGELDELERQYRTSDERVVRKKEMIAATRKRYEDLEFQLMELEARCESELEQAEMHFQSEQNFLTQKAEMRQNTLHELDHQQYLILHQATIEKEKLEREKQKFKFLFKQKQIEANELEQTIHGTNRAIYQSTLGNVFRSSPQMTIEEDQQGMSKVKFDTRSRDIRDYDYHVQLREKNRAQERPLTRYLPIRSANFDLRAHIEGAGHRLDSPHVSLTSTSCRGYLQKMGGMKFKTWNRRWFVFDRHCHSLFYYQDKTETKLRGCISFQSILEVYVDHLQSISLRSPEPREATFIVKTIGRSYYLVAPTVESMRVWVDVMITGAEGNTFARN